MGQTLHRVNMLPRFVGMLCTSYKTSKGISLIELKVLRRFPPAFLPVAEVALPAFDVALLLAPPVTRPEVEPGAFATLFRSEHTSHTLVMFPKSS